MKDLILILSAIVATVATPLLTIGAIGGLVTPTDAVAAWIWLTLAWAIMPKLDQSTPAAHLVIGSKP